ncbi:MAG: hypothetical protein J6X34_02210, partial [Clostridia bacterium]|nr:hypothetical protein [Clostridia bacterium]
QSEGAVSRRKMGAEHRLDLIFCFSGGVFRVTQIAQIVERVPLLPNFTEPGKEPAEMARQLLAEMAETGAGRGNQRGNRLIFTCHRIPIRAIMQYVGLSHIGTRLLLQFAQEKRSVEKWYTELRRRPAPAKRKAITAITSTLIQNT